MTSMQTRQETLEALDRARELIARAPSIANTQERMALAREALAISPLCADAFIVLSDDPALSLEEQLALRQRAVLAGYEAIRDEVSAVEGPLWDFVRARPFLNASVGLANLMSAYGHRREAIHHFRAVLRMNPTDDQGVRFSTGA